MVWLPLVKNGKNCPCWCRIPFIMAVVSFEGLALFLASNGSGWGVSIFLFQFSNFFRKETQHESSNSRTLHLEFQNQQR